MNPTETTEVSLELGPVLLPGSLAIPESPIGVVLFAHGSGSSRLSPRNVFVSRELQAAKFATLLFDLMTETEDQVYERRFDIELLTIRLDEAVDWVRGRPELQNLPIGLFGASTGAAAALKAAARNEGVRAVVSRGGRPDLAGDELSKVQVPTLLIVGGLDDIVIGLNKAALASMPESTKTDLIIVPGATHLFEEPGKLEQVAALAVDWFTTYL